MHVSTAIVDVKQVTPSLLTDRFRRNGGLTVGAVEGVEKTDSFGSSAAKWDRLKLSFTADYQGAVPEHLLLKIYRKGWFGGGLIEQIFYDELAAQTPAASVCPVYDFGLDQAAKDCHFLLADLAVTHTDSPPDKSLQTYTAIVEELLKYHIHWWNNPRLEKWPFMQQAGGPLRMAQAIDEADVRDSCKDFGRALAPFAQALGDDLDPAHLALLERIIERYPDAFLKRVADSPHITLLHGDAHLGNLYYPKDPTTHQMVLLDWETYKRGLGAYDLAYLLIHATSGRDREHLQGPLLDFYYQRLTAAGISGYSRADFDYDFRLSVIACTFCPIIWKRTFALGSAMRAYAEWECDELLD
ncbi:MAG: phosphotransferase [Candidatus Latescibacteria bacterium]|nr:phosphotransferase [Candidatus Latescibacterota bacterium]